MHTRATCFQMLKRIRKIFFWIVPTYRRFEVGCFNYSDADKLIRESVGKPENEQWVIAPEEDRNRVVGIVYLESRERVWE